MKKFIYIALSLVLLSACAAYNGTTKQAPKVEFLDTQMDGSLTLRVAASGRNYGDAVEKAAKAAVNEVIFKGVPVPGSAFMSKPLITEVNAEEKYQDFFYAFFTTGGAYTQFVSKEDKRAGSNQFGTSRENVRVNTTVRVMRADLRQYLLDNRIIKP